MESRNKLLRLLDSVIDALVWAISKLGLSTQQQTLRLGHLTMLLSHIRHVRYGPRQHVCDIVCDIVGFYMRIHSGKCF